jgi:hypothetical protein
MKKIKSEKKGRITAAGRVWCLTGLFFGALLLSLACTGGDTLAARYEEDILLLRDKGLREEGAYRMPARLTALGPRLTGSPTPSVTSMSTTAAGMCSPRSTRGNWSLALWSWPSSVMSWHRRARSRPGRPIKTKRKEIL